ncbi:MAG: acyl-CoA dehydrogenase family protein [Pseudonocardia sp.]|uniref:acyl-CoA dehydrogenase family protein n=1 Tax=unclassified Pseudonocardia TaxID=2619320 RepID=UPI00086F3786|nr:MULTISPECIES: acyl-CoA dehydrogenase family protein [unclassified Pseudonocardia]MBN9107552.1 acyl-CoA dehydrogenase family protein [Pseudonocardia sp.]ODV08406.1 MAG: acyl-CoA dehydrogenase [Pseudonocardia sp. SCN 73-27]
MDSTEKWFGLGPAEVALREEAEAVAASVADIAAEADAMSEIHPGIREALRASGLSGLMVPAAYGGRSESVDPLAVCLVREVFMRASSHLDSMFALQGIGSYAITVGGTDEQRAQWLPKVASLETLAALALTEENAGSDLKNVSTTLTEKDGSLVVRGAKSFISNAGAADFFVTLVSEEAGLSLVLVPADTPGLTTTPSPELIAPHVLGEVGFDDVVLPPEARLGVPGKAMSLVLGTLAVFRVSVAGAACGLAAGALAEAARHARTREQFGRPLLRHGPVAQLLADSWNDVEMARLLTYQAAAAARSDAAGALNRSSMAKVAATEAASRVVDRCVQVMGRWGLVADSPIERYYRQARPMRIYEGASEVLKLGIARALCDEI